MPPDQEASFNHTLVHDFDSIAVALSKIDLEQAEASVAQDKETILGLVASEMGFTKVNRAVSAALQEWVAETGNTALAQMAGAERATSVLISSLAKLLNAQGELDQAEALYSEAMEGRRSALGDRHPDTLVAIDSMSQLLQARGNLKQAETLGQEALEGRRTSLGEGHPDSHAGLDESRGPLVEGVRQTGPSCATVSGSVEREAEGARRPTP